MIKLTGKRVIIAPMGNARERFAAMKKGEPVPPRTVKARQLTPEDRELWLDTLAGKLAKMYRADKEAGRI